MQCLQYTNLRVHPRMVRKDPEKLSFGKACVSTNQKRVPPVQLHGLVLSANSSQPHGRCIMTDIIDSW